jgi:hypothetical protein
MKMGNFSTQWTGVNLRMVLMIKVLAPHKRQAECWVMVRGAVLVICPQNWTKATVTAKVMRTMAPKSQLEVRLANMLSFLGWMHLQLKKLKSYKKTKVSNRMVYIVHLLVGTPFMKNSSFLL